MSERDDIYTDLLLEHARHPHRRGALEHADGHGEGFNPLCGDQVQVWVSLNDDRIGELSFEGVGCAISTASASIMTGAIEGRTAHEAHEVIERFLRVATDLGAPLDELDDEQASLANVRRLPMRVKCVTLAWRAAEAALREAQSHQSAGGGHA